ncbi:methionine--tRNA ligase, cytoplasmic isoform X2 [Periplaneta americana]|uniref:methionine--tRNA ligase, cytoplasmic isoform X2 n=1 Tax=Periplaneta americana TaxID=6978 RepID=UPI0037E97185
MVNQLKNMKIFTNENNPLSLKLLISANFAQKDVISELTNVEDARFQSPRRLPVLELDSGDRLFSSNSASCFLFPPQQSSRVLVDQWLEWEATQLQPVLAFFLGATSKADVKLSTQLKDLLSFLNSALSGKTFLFGENVTVADVAIWSSLFPLATETKHQKEFLSEQTHVQRWFTHLFSQPQVKEAVEKLCPKAGMEAYRSLTNVTWYPINVINSLPETAPQPRLHSVTSIDGTTKEVPLSEAEITAAKEAWENGAAKRAKPKPRVTPVLPVPGERNVLITSALPYVNNIPHLGTIIGCVLSADVFARFSRLCNNNTLYICGTDEYGTATETKALEEGLSPQQICDKYFKIHDAVYQWFNISFDNFGRTTTTEQTEICQDIFLQLYENGFMSTESVEQLLCENCNRYLADRFVEGICPRCAYQDARGDQCDGCGHLVNAAELISPRCKVCQKTPVIRKSEQFFLELPKIEPLLRNWLEKVIDGWSNNARVITKAWLKDGLKPRCITRDLKWGIPVPLDRYRNKVFYVWFDAPFGYMSITKRYSEHWEKWWRPERTTTVSYYNFIGKDNVPFHSVMFPSTLLGANRNYTLVSYIMATEFLNYEDEKFSKSRGVGVFGNDAKETGIPSDVWRFYLLYVRPESQDSNFSWVDLATKNNSELLNNLGNFVNRALVFAEKNFGGQVPEMVPETQEWTLLALITRELKAYIAALESAKLRDGIRHILNISRHGNQYMQSQQPWVLLKGNDAERSRSSTVIGTCCNIACLLAILLKPYMPVTSDILREQLQAPSDVWVIIPEFTTLLPAGHKLGKPSPLFSKIEPARVEQLKQQFSGRQKSRSPEVDTPPQPPPPKTVNSQPNVVPAQHQGDASVIAKLSAAVAQQAELVRKIKGSGAARSIWQPHVAVLLELKQQLASTQSIEAVSGNSNGLQLPNAAEVARLEAEITKQGDLVRQMKAGGAPKNEWQPQVNILLAMKSQLAAIQGSPAPSKGKSKGKK